MIVIVSLTKGHGSYEYSFNPLILLKLPKIVVKRAKKNDDPKRNYAALQLHLPIERTRISKVTFLLSDYFFVHYST